MTVDLDAVLDSSSTGQTGVPGDTHLLRFVDAIERQPDDLHAARADLLDAVGADGVLEAAATIAAFNGLIRVADGTGIQLDDGVKAASAVDRGNLGINGYAGAASTPGAEAEAAAPVRIMTVHELFD